MGRKSNAGTRARRLTLEPLESRVALSAAGLVDVGTQPDGGLSGKITYIMGGHGYTTFMGPSPDFWSFQRGATVEARMGAVLRIDDAVEQAGGVAGGFERYRCAPLEHEAFAALLRKGPGHGASGQSGADDQHRIP